MLNLQTLKLTVAARRPVGTDTGADASAPDIASSDWDVLFNAVKDRLRGVVGDRLAALSDSHDDVLRTRVGVLECVAALEHLHTMLHLEVSRREQLEADLLAERRALEEARAELLGTQASERRAHYRSLHDSLTALPNRDFFHERLADALGAARAAHQQVAVLYLDLDGFKPINDKHGHDVGDSLLCIVAARLNSALRTEDVVGRLGGDEFGCLLVDMPGREPLARLAHKLFDAVSAPLQIGALALRVCPSIGIAISREDDTSAELLLKNADIAMYHAKRHGTGHAFFDWRPER